ncbi:MAG TPA: HAMP domain-containing sensor histidine kinase [Verrucomicrobiae bacterium]|nr:HAMP domain-containing sensor histidine kinase [Verrucomicrobiae bacterium]
MIGGPSRALRRHALRTAWVGTALVAVGLAAVLTATDVLVSNFLIGAVDHRLQEWVDHGGTTGAPRIVDAAPRPDFDQPIFAWVVLPGGGCRRVGAVPALPSTLCRVQAPATADVAGTLFRLIGRRRPGTGRVVVGTSLAPVSGLMGDLVTAELVVGPLLLLLVFLGALAVGSRVGGPVERMRQRQLALTADASHELRTPLTVIQAETNLALAGDDRHLRASLVRVSQELTRMRRIVEDLLWLARFDAQPRPPTPAVLDLVTVAQLAAERFATLAAARGVSLAVDAPEGVLLVTVPVAWMDRLVGVLVDNACRHARSRVGLHVGAVEGRRVELAVSDDGDGIPDAELPRIFDRFHRATPRGDGAGLGLAIADAVVGATHGGWQVTTRDGGGARFAVAWPASGSEGPGGAEPSHRATGGWITHRLRRGRTRPPTGRADR